MDADEHAGRVHRFLDDRAGDVTGMLQDWVRIPSVAGGDDGAAQVERSAVWLADALRDTGFPEVELWRADGTTAVHAQWCAAPGAPTVLVYSHHDVRAAKRQNWEVTRPFDPVLRDGRVYGRGTSDAKGQVLAHLWGVRAHLAATGADAPAVNLKLLVEGEEETGSAHLAELLAQHRDRLAADLVVFSDTLLWSADHPAVCTSMRGTMLARLEVRGTEVDVHSGDVSGAAPNAALELARLIAGLHDGEGRVAVPGFYDAVAEPDASRRAELAALPFDEADWLRRSGTGAVVGEPGYTVLERLWLRPAVEVLKVAAGDPGDTARAVIPSTASADISIRYVPDQDAATIADELERWVARTIGPGVRYELSVSEGTAQDPYVTPDVPAVQALSRAMARGFRSDGVGRMGNAGGGPAVLLGETIGAPVVFFGTGLVEDRWHDSDESVSSSVLHAGAATLACLWEELGTRAPGGPSVP
ncbi:acetylornithine deacetylase/succinyl-diaminopimelate desuccinylase-like protein [Georgenia soli]|uniref:Acetylornithine deacetylase/succinyl-diaminopimelate desuccinylase-like protein n=1 Tax=Georgenia soli TaxID=638953 RepID=A0A2A9EIQ1_9MICO|nr:M20/M25/M40 family metallo-hydrolase [Georgenia soli]PFG38957.1 acetylornithine deacetylase/succinyl-diaminopimelate desuccinylase-like protein [Georgenia soli]